MAINYNDPYNQGIGTLDVGNMNLGQVPVDNMQQANWLNTISGGMMGTTPEQDAQNAALEQIQEIKGTQFEGYPMGTNPAWVEEHKTEYPDLYEKYQNKQKQIQDLKKKYPENIDIQQAYLDDEYSDIEGQTAFNPISIGTGILGMIKAGLSKKQMIKILARDKLMKEAKPVVGGFIASQGAKRAAKAAGAYSPQIQHDPGGRDTWHGQTAAKEKAGQQVAGPGFGKGAYFNRGGRVSYFDGGLLSLWPR